MFSSSLEQTLNSLYDFVKRKSHEFVTVEHLLLSLLENPEASNVLVACGANLDRLRAGLSIYLEETTPRMPSHMNRAIQPTMNFQRVLQRAIYQVQSTARPEVTGTHILTAVFGEHESQAVYFLNQENVTRIDVVNYLTQGIARMHQPPPSPIEPQPYDDSSLTDASFESAASSEDNMVDMYATNLNERARAGKLDPVIGRKLELERAIQVLSRRNKNNPLFVGESGVGKTAIAEGLAQMIVDGKVPQKLMYSTIYSLDLGTMLAGTKYRGDFEKRFKAVLKALGRHSGAVVFFDEIHNLIGAGSATGGTMDAANLIKPMLSNGELRCMGATTYDEYRNFISKDKALLRRFQKVDIEEPSREHTIKILQGLKSRFESYHKVTYTKEALQRTVDLASRYLPDRHMPDKAIDIIDEVGAIQQLLPVTKRRRSIKVKDIDQVVAKIARIPLEQLSSTDKQRLLMMPDRLREVVFGQNSAIEQLCDSIKLSRAGLRDPQKPVGSFLMAGPTGVGKTELTRALADALGVELLRFDMSEYMERHSVSRLIGAPPGYVGFDQGGLLSESVMRHPHAVLLLDEIEKAHPDMYSILLQVMDYGMLTDNNGRKIDFRHVIIIMTTNAGAELLERNNLGFSEQDNSDGSMGVIKQQFTPEFRNRLDAVLMFKHLEPTVVEKILEKNIEELKARLVPQGVEIELTLRARQWLMERGYDRKMGARPMERLIEQKIKKPLANQLLFGSLANSNEVIVIDYIDGQMVFDKKRELAKQD